MNRPFIWLDPHRTRYWFASDLVATSVIRSMVIVLWCGVQEALILLNNGLKV